MATRIDYTSMMGAGSKLALNGSTFGVGAQTGSLKSAASLAGTSGVSLSNGVLTIKQAGFVLDGYDLRGVGVVVAADNVTIKNSLGSPSTSGRYGIFQDKGASGLTVEYCTFDGQKSAGIGGNMVDTIINAYDGAMTIRNNEFINIPSDAINIQAGTVARNYFSGTGYQSGAHADAISVQATTAPVTIRENYIDAYKRADAPQEPNSAIKIVSHFGAINNVTVDSNILVGGGYALYVSPAGNPISNVKITNNDIGMSNWGDLYPGDHGSGFVFQGNYNFVTNAHLLSGGASNPVPSPAPAQPAKPVPTPTTSPTSTFDALKNASTLSDIKATIAGSNIADGIFGTAGKDVIKLAAGNDICLAGSGNDIIVGGAGRDLIVGNAGKDAFVFSSIKDSRPGAGRDLILDWTKGSDTIDLHLIDANAQATGNQAFSWIGTGPYTGHAGELRYSVTASGTVIGGDVNGDGKSDFQIQIMGKHAFSAADFLL